MNRNGTERESNMKWTIIFKRLAEWIKSLFMEPKLNSTEQVYWVNHICDDYVNASQKAVGMYANLHGFEGLQEDGTWIYWVGIDVRFLGIRTADFVIRCKNKSTYDFWIEKTRQDLDSIPQGLHKYDNLYCRDGDDVNIKFIYKWGGEEKTFNVRFGTDRYAEEK